MRDVLFNRQGLAKSANALTEIRQKGERGHLNKSIRMSSVKYPVAAEARVGRRSLQNPFQRTAIFKLRALSVAFVLSLVGCTSQERAPDLAPPVHVSEGTWREIDNDISAASLAAKEPARKYAHDSMERWRDRIQKRTDDDFIPWFTDYWTQQWLAMKVAWYKLSAEEETDPTVKRLAAYLQEQYRDRVLEPVAKEISPDEIKGQATKLYIQGLREKLQDLPQRYGVPSNQFDRRTKDIPAIALGPYSANNASLYQIVHADPITKLPAYVALINQICNAPGGAGLAPSDSRISPVAKRASEKLLDRLATGGGASAAAALVGGVAGVAISLGAAGYGAAKHEKDRPKMEAQLRENLNAALDDMYRELLEDPARGVMAGVHSVSGQIEGSLAKTFTQPVALELVPSGTPLPCEDPPSELER